MSSIKSTLFGLAVGDALGVPVEFRNREFLRANPVADMREGGTHKQPAGTWSDDSSLTFCLAEALTTPFDPQVLAGNFISWRYQNYWTADREVFDIGISTAAAIERLAKGIPPQLAGGMEESENGNGSLMRILPLVFYVKDRPIEERFELTKIVSSLTHQHIRSVIACWYYLEFARLLLIGKNKKAAYQALRKSIPPFLKKLDILPGEIAKFDRLLKDDISLYEESDIQSSGYVVHTLEASIWCLLRTDSYKAAVLKAVNLGEDTDTTGAVTGGIAGLLYGFDSIPSDWIAQLARKDDINDLAERLAAAIPPSPPPMRKRWFNGRLLLSLWLFLSKRLNRYIAASPRS